MKEIPGTNNIDKASLNFGGVEMNTKHDPAKKQAVLSRYKSGEPISRIIQDTGIPRSTIYNWLKLSKVADDDPKEPTLPNFRLLEKKVKRLEGIIEILKTADCSPKDPLKVKLDALEKLHEQHTYSVHMICEALEVPRGNSTQLVKGTFRSAYESRKPAKSLTFHTDRGTNYRAKAFCAYLKSLGVTQSFSQARVPYDNSVMESFFSNLKREELYRTKYRSENEFRTAVDKYMAFYNDERPHATNQYKTPSQKERDFLRSHAGTGGVSN